MKTMKEGPENSLDAATRLAVERTYLAHENALLAWVRTATSLIGFGFSIQQFFRVTRGGEPPDDRLIGPNEFGFLMMIIGLLGLVMAVVHHRSDLIRLRSRYQLDESDESILPGSRVRIMAALIATLGIVGLLSMMLR
jgi:putative membrane protein